MKPERKQFKKLWKMAGLLAVLITMPGLLSVHHVTAEPLPGPRIVGGKPAAPGAWPWIAALVHADEADLYDGQYCGGTLVAARWVLTAGHCVYDADQGIWREPAAIDVVLGLHDLTTDTGDRIRLKRIVGHPDYNPDTLDSDLALLELSRPASAQPVSLFTDSGKNLAGTLAMLVGWGSLDGSNDPDYPGVLQQVRLPVVNDEDCRAAYPGEITDRMFCTGYPEGGKDACTGDSGGPVMVWNDGRWQLAGIISWGEGCALPGYYGVNTRVAGFARFISSYIGVTPTPAPSAPSDFPWELFLPAIIHGQNRK